MRRDYAFSLRMPHPPTTAAAAFNLGAVSSQPLPIVAIVGRPNVGKSTLVNRILGKREAVTQEQPGVTRDRREFEADWSGSSFLLVDTGGWELDPIEDVAVGIRDQVEAAVRSADVVVLVVDSRAGLVEEDAKVVDLLRRSETPVILAANKVESGGLEAEVGELWGLGLGDPHQISALHGTGTGDLLDSIVEQIPEIYVTEERDTPPRLAIIGRPNAGKSTLLNRLLGQKRVIVSSAPGTTRDPIDAMVEIDGQDYVMVDTAGLRRAPRISESADYYAVQRAHRVVKDADIALMVIDAVEGVTHQDQRIAESVAKAGTGLVVILNKWDALDEDTRLDTERSVADRLSFVDWAPLLRMSALTGSRVGKLGGPIEAVLEARERRVSTGTLNRWVNRWAQGHLPPTRKGRRPKILYSVQAATGPPTFVLFTSGGDLGNDYLRFIEGRIRDEVDLVGTPVRVFGRRRSRRVR